MEELLRKYPQKTIYLIVAARLNIAIGDQQRGLDRLRKATEQEPNLGEAWSALSTALLETGDVAGATSAMERAVHSAEVSFGVW